MARIQVPRYDFAARSYVHNATADLLTDADLSAHLKREFKVEDGRARTAYLRQAGIRLPDVFDRIGQIKPRELMASPLARIVTDDNLWPWFAPLVAEGFEEGIQSVENDWEPLVGTRVPVNAGSIEAYSLLEANTSDAYDLRTLGQGSKIPVAEIRAGKSIVSITKKGRGLQLSYEAARRAPVALTGLWLRVLGIRIGRSRLGEVTDAAINGIVADGSDDPVIVRTAVAGTITLSDMLYAQDVMESTYGYPVTDIGLSPVRRLALMVAQWPTSGDPIFPGGNIGATFNNAAVHRLPAMPDTDILFFNRQVALVLYEDQPFGTEDERDPSRQIITTYGTMTDAIAPSQIRGGRVVLTSDWTP